VIGEQPELTAETLEIGDTSSYCWRNCFSCINLLRVLNKLTKWKHSRIMVRLFIFDAIQLLLNVKHNFEDKMSRSRNENEFVVEL
jgi:hypothetical protein